MIRTVPHDRNEAHYREECFFLRCGEEARLRHSTWEDAALDDALKYFDRFAALRPARRAMLEACVAGVLIGLGMGG